MPSPAHKSSAIRACVAGARGTASQVTVTKVKGLIIRRHVPIPVQSAVSEEQQQPAKPVTCPKPKRVVYLNAKADPQRPRQPRKTDRLSDERRQELGLLRERTPPTKPTAFWKSGMPHGMGPIFRKLRLEREENERLQALKPPPPSDRFARQASPPEPAVSAPARPRSRFYRPYGPFACPRPASPPPATQSSFDSSCDTGKCSGEHACRPFNLIWLADMISASPTSLSTMSISSSIREMVERDMANDTRFAAVKKWADQRPSTPQRSVSPSTEWMSTPGSSQLTERSTPSWYVAI